jgi:pimeloyl-ACP methyl ester carboxylesterase
VLLAPSPPLQVQGRSDLKRCGGRQARRSGRSCTGCIRAIRALARGHVRLNGRGASGRVRQSAGALESGFARRQRKRGIDVPAGAIKAPTLLLYGEKDEHFPPELNRRISLFLAGDSIACRMPDTGGWCTVSAPCARRRRRRTSGWGG